jgi:hypothetical protein
VTAAHRLEIVVDELIVRGLSSEQARVAADALEARLTALASQRGPELPARADAFRRLPSVDAESPAGVGEAVAGAMWSGISGEGKR